MTVETHPQPGDAPPVAPASLPVRQRLRLSRWPVALIIAGVLVVAMFVLPPPVPLLALLLLVAGGLFVAARDAAVTPAGLLADLRALSARSPSAEADGLRRRIALGSAWLGTALMVVAAVGFRPSPVDEPLTSALLFAVAGALSLGVAAWLSPSQPLLASAGETALSPARSHWGPTALGVVLLGALAHISSAKVRGDVVVQPITNEVQFLLLAAGIGLVVWGLSGAPSLDLSGWRARVRWSHTLPLLAIFALALGLRLWNLGEAVRGSVDEAVVLEGIGHSWNYRAAGLVTQVSDRLSASQLFPFWQTIAMNLLGRSLDALRVTNAIVGALTVFALYLLARSLFDHKTGLIAALLLATFPPHLHFSRIAMAHIADPLLGTLALAFLIRGLKYNRRLDWALCGASLGLTQYFFEGGRLLFPPLLVLCAAVLSIQSSRSIRRHARGMVVAALVALFVAAPVYYSLFSLDQQRASRLSDSGVSLDTVAQVISGRASSEQTGDFLNRLTFPFQLYVHQPEIASYYGGQTALVLPWVVPLLLVGVAWVFWRLRAPAVILLLWLFFGGLGNVLMRDIAIYTRFIVVFPALVLTIAAGIRYGLPLLLPALRDGRLALVAYGLAVLVALGQSNYYFGEHLPNYMPQLRTMSTYDGMDAVLRAQSLPATTQVFLVGQPPYDGEVSRIFDGFLSRRINDMALHSLATDDLTLAYIAALPRDRSYAFFVAPGSEHVLESLRLLFELESPRYTPYADVPPDKAYVLYVAHWRPSAG